MPSHLRRPLVALCFALLALWAWHPLFEHGLRGEELALLEQLERVDSTADAALFEPLSGHVGAATWIGALDSVFLAAYMDHGPLLWRAHNVVLLLVAAWLLGRLVRRLVEPWTGAELARASSWAASMLFALHPLAVGALGAVRAGPALAALSLSLGCLVLYVDGRKLRDPRRIAAAALFAALASTFHGAALALPLWIAGTEYAASGRSRTASVKRRSAAAAFAVACALVALDSVLRSFALGEVRVPAELAALVDALNAPVETAAVVVERLGMLLLAVNLHVTGAPGFVLAGLAALATLHPLLSAARSAPRLWGWILAGCALALGATELAAQRLRVHPQDLADADTLLASCAAVAAASAIAITSRSGWARSLLPALVALLYAALAHAAATAHSAAAREVEGLHGQLDYASGQRPLLLVDAPQRVLGVRAFEGSPWRTAPAPAFALWLDSEHSAALRVRGEGSSERWWWRVESQDPARARWVIGALRPSSSSRAPVTWQREGRSPELENDPLEFGALSVMLETPVDSSKPPVMAWKSIARDGQPEREGRVAGVWSVLGDAAQASFDLSRAPDWLAAEPVRLIWSESGWSRIDSALLAPRLPAPALEPEPSIEGDDWRFVASVAPARERDPRLECALVCVDFERLECVELPALFEADGGVRVPGARAWMEAARARGVNALGWALEVRVERVAVQRLRGGAR